jgi:hypothetical protein
VLEARRAQNRAAPRSRDHTIKPRTPIVTKSAAIAKYQRVSTAINSWPPAGDLEHRYLPDIKRKPKLYSTDKRPGSILPRVSAVLTFLLFQAGSI